MTRKHYRLIADVIKGNEVHVNCLHKPSLIEDLISLFKADNVRFNADKFKQYINGDIG